MSKVIGMLVALAMFCAVPSVAFAQGGGGNSGGNGGSNVSSGNTQTGNINQSANGGDSTANGGGSGGSASSGNGGNAGNQAAICQQNAGRDANCSINQSQHFGGTTVSGTSRTSGHVGTTSPSNVGVRSFGVSGGGHGVSGVRSVVLARTGFDAWILALVGGVSLVGGLGLLAAQRRTRLNG